MVLIYTSACEDPLFPVPLTEEIVLSLEHDSFCQRLLSCRCSDVSGISTLSHWPTYLVLWQYQALLIVTAVIIQKSGVVMAPDLFCCLEQY